MNSMYFYRFQIYLNQFNSETLCLHFTLSKLNSVNHLLNLEFDFSNMKLECRSCIHIAMLTIEQKLWDSLFDSILSLSHVQLLVIWLK